MNESGLGRICELLQNTNERLQLRTLWSTMKQKIILFKFLIAVDDASTRIHFAILGQIISDS